MSGRNYKKYKSAAGLAQNSSTTAQNSVPDNSRYVKPLEPETTKEARYGSVERKIYETETIGGAAGSATIEGASQEIINADKTGIGRLYVHDTVRETVQNEVIHGTTAETTANRMVKPLVSDIYKNKAWGETNGNGISERKKGLLKTAAYTAAREIDKAVGGGGKGGEFSDRTKGQAARQGYRAGKYAVLAGYSIVRGSFRLGRYSAKLAKDVKAGTISAKKARLFALKRAGSSVAGSGRSIKKILKEQAAKGIENFKGSDDLGMQAITKPKDIYVRTRRGWKMAKATGRAVKGGVKGTARAAQKIVQKTAQAARAVAALAKKLFANPLVLKAAAIAIVVIFAAAIILAIASAVSSIIPTISLKSDDEELTKTYKYVTELDARLTEEIRTIPDQWGNGNIDEFHFYLNGYETDADSITIYTNADTILAYFDTKYDDYAFDKLIYGLFGGTNVKSEIKGIHNTLHSYSTNKWKEEIEHSVTVTDPLTDEEVTYTWTETIWHMDINVTLGNFDVYLNEHIDELLTPEQQERLAALREAGLYTTKQELGNPFGDEGYFISSRFGWRIHPIHNTLSDHQGIDIPKPEGTLVQNVMMGTVKTVAYDDSRGNYVIVELSDRQVLYQHLSSTAVSEGQQVNRGDTIGTVGSTGDSTGPHLHIEYSKKGFTLCPSFYLAGLQGAGGAGSGDIVQVAASQIGNVGGEPYWSWYGFGGHVAWCACFVSWCANECGYIDAGVIPKFAWCPSGKKWFQSTGQWQDGHSGYIPKPGDIIFFNFSDDRNSTDADHVGIVESCDGSTVYTVEGNTSNSVARRSYNIGQSSIMGYGTPAYGN